MNTEIVKPSYDDLVVGIEKELYTAIEALERGDLIGVRQCSARAQSGAAEAWQTQRRQMENQDP